MLDLGGMPAFWRNAPAKPAHVLTVNLAPADPSKPLPSWLDHMQGDACELPAAILQRGWDLIISNSLLEHVGGHWKRQRFADQVRSTGCRYWVQTPYRYFPIEPHLMFPGAQFLPFPARMALARTWPVRRSRTRAAALSRTNEIELLSATQMRAYFPEAVVWFERYAGLPKSMVAIRV